MTEEELSAAVDRLTESWRAARAEQSRIRSFKRIGKIRRAQIAAARAKEAGILRKIEGLARDVGMKVQVGTLPILVEAR